MLMGALLGYFITVTTLGTVQATIDMYQTEDGGHGYQLGDIENQIISGIGSLIGTALGYKLSFMVVILFNAVVSSYCIVRGTSFIAGGYPSEIDVVQDLYDDKIDLDLSGSALWYMIALVTLTLFSFCFQFNRLMKSPI